MIYRFFKRNRDKPMSAKQANTQTQEKYRERLREMIQLAAQEIKLQVEQGRHSVDLDHHMDALMASDVCDHFRSLGYGVETQPGMMQIRWICPAEEQR